MRAMLFLVGSVTAGTLGVTQGVIPVPTQMVQAIRALGGDPAQIRSVNLDPVDAYNRVLPQILRGHTPEELGFHVEPVTIQQNNFRTMNNAAVGGSIAQSNFKSSLLSEVQQSNLRMQNMSNFARNPSAWHGAPPH